MKNNCKINAEAQHVERRSSNLDLLRIIGAVFVIFQHFCEASSHNAFGFAQDSTKVGYGLLALLYGFARIAVPVFMILSGYFSINSSNQRIGKAISLFMMACFYSCLGYFVDTVFQVIRGTFEFSFMKLVDVLFVNNYYLYLFCGVYALSPFLNKGLTILSQKQYKTLILISILLFSIWSTGVNLLKVVAPELHVDGAYFVSMTGTQMGFNITNFILFYIIGGYLRLHYKIKAKDRLRSIIIIVSVAVITTLVRLLIPHWAAGMFYYDNILLLLEGSSCVLLFLTIKMKDCKLISFLGMKSFAVFLVHGLATRILEFFLPMKNVISKGLIGVLLAILIFVVGVYILSVCIACIVDFTFLFINKKWKKTKLYNINFFNANE